MQDAGHPGRPVVSGFFLRLPSRGFIHRRSPAAQSMRRSSSATRLAMNSTYLLLGVASASLLGPIRASESPPPPAAATASPAPAHPREQLAAQIDRNVEANERSLSAARAQTRRLPPLDQRRFLAAERDVRRALRRLHHSLDAAERVSVENWERARAVLASDYDAYTEAVAQAQRIATATLAASTASRGEETAPASAPAD